MPRKTTSKLPATRRKPQPRRHLQATLAFIAAQLFVAAGGAAVGLTLSLRELPDVGMLQHYVPFETTKIYDTKGKLVANVHGEENRVVVPLNAIPKHVQQAVIAVEDDRFYLHHGISPRGILRAVLTDLSEGGSVQGGSTITQQLAKNLFLAPGKTIPRKIADAWLAIQIERRFSKDQILELYLNQVYWGHNAYGVEAAAQNYFSKHATELTIGESAMLAYLLRGPERYSPFKNPEAAHRGQQVALRKMLEAGFITPKQLEANSAKPKFATKVQSYAYHAPYFSSYLLNQLIHRYGEEVVMKGGLKVTSTLDLELQRQAETLVREYVAKQGKRYGFSQAALVVLDPKTGYIRAMVGGVDYKTSKFNRVIQAYRQPGSSFKPFVYLTAFSKGMMPWVPMSDAPVSYDSGSAEPYTPKNYDGKTYGEMTLRKALERSNNVVAVKLLDQLGVKSVIETAHQVGIQSELGPNLSLALGSSEVTPLELASAYGVFAANGWRTEPIVYFKVEDRAGTVLEEVKPKLQKVYDEEPVKILNDVLQGVVKWGTGASANFGRPAAGKTGTTSEHRDAWFVGYTPQLVGLVWVGNDNNTKMRGGSTGGGICAPLWKQVMTLAHKGLPVESFAPAKIEPPPPPTEEPVIDGTPSTPVFYVPGASTGTKPKPARTPRGEAAREPKPPDFDEANLLD